MSHGVKLIGKRYAGRIILNSEGVSIGRISKAPTKRQGFLVFLDGVYWRSNDIPNRRGGGTCVGVRRLKDAPALIEKTLIYLAESDAKAATALQLLIDDVVTVDVSTVSGSQLNWLVAKSFGFVVGAELSLYPVVNATQKPYVLVRGNAYSPTEDLSLIFKLINDCVDSIDKLEINKYFVRIKDTICSGESIEVAILRTFVMKNLGANADIPACLKNSNE